MCQAVQDCAGDDPCTAAWQATYQYYADRQYDMAQWQALLGAAIAFLQYTSADRTADLQYDIANRQMLIAEEEYERYKCVYVECEDRLAAEICAETVPEVQYDIHADRALRDVRKQFGLLEEKLARSRRRYCASDYFRRSCELQKSEALAVIAARESAYRYAERRQDYLEERRWSRRLNILQHGRNVFSGQSASYNSGSGLATEALAAGQRAKDQLFGNLFNIGNNLITSYYQQFMGPNPLGGGYGGGGAIQSGIAGGQNLGNISVQSGVAA